MAGAENYRADLVSVVLIAKQLLEIDVPAMLRAIDMAETVGPVVDPTLYRSKAKTMREDRDLLRAALPLWEWVQKVRAEHEKWRAEHEH